MKNIQKINILLRRNTYALIAVELLFATMLSGLVLGHSAAALGQLSSRSVQLSDSGPSGGSISSGVGSGTKVAAKFAFSVASSSTIGGIAIDFCSNSALSWDTCSAPLGLNTNWATTQIYNQTNMGTGSFAVYTTSGGQQANNRIVIYRATAATIPASSSFELGDGSTNGLTNPSSTGTIYARIYTYDTAAHAESHNSTSTTDDNNDKDFGGVALSIANVITITARVQESLIFCVSLAAPTSNCGGTSQPAVILGHGTYNKVIDSTAVDTGSCYDQLSTNAASGADIRMHTSVSGGGLDSGGGTIPPANSGSATPAAMTAGNAGFGLYVANGSGGTGTVTADSDYNDGTSTHYAMDATSGSNVTTTYGDIIASAGAPVSNVNSQLTFAATASNTTPAGVYTANISLVATGKF